MSVVFQTAHNLLSLSISHIALNPVLTAALLYVLTKGPPQLRNRLASRFASLRDPQRLPRIVKALKALLALGLLGTVNQQLNKIALNSWRLTSQKKRWYLKKEIAVVTGGCSGIGELIVQGLLKRGVTVAILDIQQLPPGLRGLPGVNFFACNITDPAAVYSTADRIRATLGSPSILINNAGILKLGTILDTSDEWLRKIFDVNLLSNFTTVKAFLPDMIAKNKGHIVTVASNASFVAVGGIVDYCSTKAGVFSFHEGLNQELKLHYKAPNVLLTSVHPNWVRTPLLKPVEQALQAANSPIVEPQAVADAVIYQITNASSGQIFIPQTSKSASLLRGFPNWFQERFRAGVSKSILQGLK